MGAGRRYRRGLADAVSSEANAYGWTLAIWGAGALVLSVVGKPGVVGVFAFAGGALLAQSSIALLALGWPQNRFRQRSDPKLVLGVVHLLSIGVALAVAWGLAAALTAERDWAYFTVGLAAAGVYQLALGLEVALTIRPERADDAHASAKSAPSRARGPSASLWPR